MLQNTVIGKNRDINNMQVYNRDVINVQVLFINNPGVKTQSSSMICLCEHKTEGY